MIRRHFTIASYLIAIVALADQFTKHWILDLMQPPRITPVTSYLNFVLVWNKGVTFGIFNNVDHHIMTYFLITLAALILFLLGRWLWRTTSSPVAIGLGVIMGGAIGNVIDRVRFGAVLDFLDFYYHGYHWYAFNIADAAIVSGVCLLMLDSLVRGR